MDEALTPALLRAIDRAETECGIHQTRLRKAVEARGGMAAAREYLRARAGRPTALTRWLRRDIRS